MESLVEDQIVKKNRSNATIIILASNLFLPFVSFVMFIKFPFVPESAHTYLVNLFILCTILFGVGYLVGHSIPSKWWLSSLIPISTILILTLVFTFASEGDVITILLGPQLLFQATFLMVSILGGYLGGRNAKRSANENIKSNFKSDL